MNTSVWVIDDDDSIRWVLDRALSQEGHQVTGFEDADEALNRIEAGQPRPDVLISDIRMPGTDGLRMLNILQRQCPELPVIIMTAHSDLDSAVASYQGGAFEYLPKPFDVDEALALVSRALRARDEAETPSPAQADSDTEIIGEAPSMQEVFRAIGRLSHSGVTVLLNGASGTGKELVARALHRHSVRHERPFVALNMAAIPSELIESELFGHEKGAFTGADSQRHGCFERADRGTLFLDEIGDMPLDAQTRLLRVLQENEFYRVGGTRAVQVDVRIIAATHQPLEELVRQGAFREDLFYRLNVIRIPVPALAERREDIPRLAAHFLQQAAWELGVEPRVLHPDAESHLCSQAWPGNVRELENTCRWLTVMAAGREIRVDDLPPALRGQEPAVDPDGDWEQGLFDWADQSLARGDDRLLDRAQPAFERALIRAALKHSGGRRKEASALLGWGRNTLTRKIQALGLDPDPDPDPDDKH